MPGVGNAGTGRVIGYSGKCIHDYDMTLELCYIKRLYVTM